MDSTEADVLIPEEVLAKSEEFDGKEIHIKGVLTWIPFVDSFGLGGASPGFQTENGAITVGGIQPAYDAATNKYMVIVRGIYDAKSRFLKFSDISCEDCIQVIP